MASLAELSNDEKRALFAEFEKTPNRKEWLKERGFASPWFYKSRKAFLKAEKGKFLITTAGRKLSPEALQKIKDAQARRWANAKVQPSGKRMRDTVLLPSTPFHRATREEKLRLIREYDALPFIEKAPWKKKHLGNVDTGLLAYYRQQFRKEGQYTIMSIPAIRKASSQEPVNEEALLAEYDTLTVPGDKTAWLKARNLTFMNIHSMKKRAHKALNGASSHPAETALSIVPEPIPVPHNLVTLSDAIEAYQARIDIEKEVLDHFRRMLRTGK